MRKLIKKAQRLHPQWFDLLYKEVVVLKQKSPQVEGFSRVYCEIFPFIQILIAGVMFHVILIFFYSRISNYHKNEPLPKAAVIDIWDWKKPTYLLKGRLKQLRIKTGKTPILAIMAAPI